jgi:membrane protein
MSEQSRSHGVKAEFVKLGGLLKETGVRWWDDNCLRLGAALAYYAVFSIFPLLLLAVTAVGFFLGHDPATRARLLDAVATASSPEFKTLFDETLRNMQTHATARGVGAVIGLVTLFVGASAVFSELETTLNQIWRVKAQPTNGVWSTVVRAIKDKATSFAVVIGAALALLGSLGVSAALSAVDQSVESAVPGAASHVTLWIIAEAVGSIGVLTLVLAAMFRMIPQTEVKWGDVLGGAFLTAILFTATKRLLAWYLGHLGSYAAYGAVGGFLGLLTWIYLASLFLFFGAEFTRVYAERFGSVSRVPRSSSAPDDKGHPVSDHAGHPADGADAHVLTKSPVGSERRDDERDGSPIPWGTSEEADRKGEVTGARSRESHDEHAKNDRVLHG